jgi:hypothetical protein
MPVYIDSGSLFNVKITRHEKIPEFSDSVHSIVTPIYAMAR